MHRGATANEGTSEVDEEATRADGSEPGARDVPDAVRPGLERVEEAGGPGELPPIQEILPHRRAMLFLEAVLASTEDRAHGRARIPAALCASDGARSLVPSTLAMEMAAQLAAYHASLPAWRKGADARDRGFLVRLTNCECSRSTLEVEVSFDVRVELTGSMSRLAMYKVVVGQDGEEFLHGQLNIMSGG